MKAQAEIDQREGKIQKQVCCKFSDFITSKKIQLVNIPVVIES